MQLSSVILLTIVVCASANTINQQPNSTSVPSQVDNGSVGRDGDLRYHCSIFINVGHKWRFVSGTLIAPNLVLTVLAPFQNAREVRVYYGSNQLPRTKMVRGKAIIKHPKHDNANRNLGILELTRSINDGFAVPAMLPQFQCRSAVFDNQQVFVAGFGMKSEYLFIHKYLNRMNRIHRF